MAGKSCARESTSIVPGTLSHWSGDLSPESSRREERKNKVSKDVEKLGLFCSAREKYLDSSLRYYAPTYPTTQEFHSYI